MEVVFTKGPRGRTCTWTAHLPGRRPIPGSTMAAGADVPHDLATFVIEGALGLEHGFWGCVADGATFRSLGRPRTRPGRAVIQRHVEDLDRAERLVNDAFFGWRARRSPASPGPQADVPTPGGHPEVRRRVGSALDDMACRWLALAEGEELTLVWPLATARDRRGGPRRRSHR